MAIEKLVEFTTPEIAPNVPYSTTIELPETLGTRTLAIAFNTGTIKVTSSAGILLSDIGNGNVTLDVPAGVTSIGLELTATETVRGATVMMLADLRYEEKIVSNLLGLPLHTILKDLTNTSNKLVNTVTPNLYFEAVRKGYVGSQDEFIRDIINTSSIYDVAKEQGFTGSLSEFVTLIMAEPTLNITDIKNALLEDSDFTDAIASNLDYNIIANSLINNQDFINKIKQNSTDTDAVAVTVSFDVKRANVIGIERNTRNFFLFSTERLATDTEIPVSEIKTNSDIIHFKPVE